MRRKFSCARGNSGNIKVKTKITFFKWICAKYKFDYLPPRSSDGGDQKKVYGHKHSVHDHALTAPRRAP